MNVNGLPGVSISIIDQCETGCTIVIENHNRFECTFGEFFSLEKYINGKWIPLPYTAADKNIAWFSIGYPVSGDAPRRRELAVDWEWLYGRLDDGLYRIVKDGSTGHGASLNNYYFTAEFTIAVGTYPPKLKLESIGDDNINRADAITGTYDWQWEDKENPNQSICVCADSAHPLEMDYSIPKGIFGGNIVQVTADTTEIQLQFTLKPDRYTAERWDDRYLGDSAGAGEPETVILTKGGAIPVSSDGHGYIYAVHAYFTQGDVYYSFQAVSVK